MLFKILPMRIAILVGILILCAAFLPRKPISNNEVIQTNQKLNILPKLPVADKNEKPLSRPSVDKEEAKFHSAVKKIASPK